MSCEFECFEICIKRFHLPSLTLPYVSICLCNTCLRYMCDFPTPHKNKTKQNKNLELNSEVHICLNTSQSLADSQAYLFIFIN